MAILVEMPKLTDTMTEGVLRRWAKKEGEAVEPGQVLGEVETDKATMELEAFDRGTILKLLVGEGDAVPPGGPIAILGKPGEDISALLAQAATRSGKPAASKPAPASPAATPAPAASRPAAPTVIPRGDATPGPRPPAVTLIPGGDDPRTTRPASPVALAGKAAVAPAAAPPPGRVPASPLVRRIAREQGVDLSSVAGSGPGGRIVKRDLDALAETAATARPAMRAVPTPDPAAPGPAAPAANDVLVPHSPMRKTIARRLTESKQTIPHYYLEIETNAEPLEEFRAQANRDLGETGSRLRVNDIVLKAVALALREVPEVNASWRDDGILRHARVDLSVAVAIDDGLVTPVVRSADQKSLGEIAREMHALAERARARKLRPEEMTNGTFSVSNLGMFGIERFLAVINPPEAAILAVGAVLAKPVVRGDALVPGKTVVLSLSADHRVVDGAIGARFLQVLKDFLEHPMRLVL